VAVLGHRDVFLDREALSGPNKAPGTPIWSRDLLARAFNHMVSQKNPLSMPPNDKGPSIRDRRVPEARTTTPVAARRRAKSALFPLTGHFRALHNLA
jgi:hypothetical protein